MVKSIADVLTERETRKLRRIEKDMADMSLAEVLENVLHIDCMLNGRGVVVGTYTSLKSSYSHLKKSENSPAVPKMAGEEELRKRRAGHLVFGQRRHEVLLDELRIRTGDIMAHKWYLSETEDEDIGLARASAHWLKEVSPEFYARSEAHHREFGMDFEWRGMEKAVCIRAPDSRGRPSYYAIVMHSDIHFEENIAQLGGGLPAAAEWQRKCKDVRQRFIQMHRTKYFCVLGEPK